MNNNIGILTLPFNKNIGGQLQGYALQEVIRQLGYRATTINWNKYDLPFIKEYVKTVTVNSKTSGDIYKSIVENKFDTIIIGSDQIWRDKWMSVECAFLSQFAGYKPNIFSYAASFGTPEWQWSNDTNFLISKSLRNFQDISVREEDAVNQLRDKLDVESKLVCDPTLLLPRNHYIKLCREIPENRGGIFTYILDNNSEHSGSIKEISERFGKRIRKVNDPSDVKEWIAHIRDCDCVITDSYHGCVFSIIFNKPFICLGNESRGSSRFSTLINKFNISDRFSTSNIDLLTVSPNIDYKDFTRYSLDYLKRNLDRSCLNLISKKEVDECKYNAVVCAIAKNENAYINEWVNWYIDKGFDHIYLFDNNDEDSEYIGNFIDRKDKVTIYDVRGIKQKALQLRCYNEFYLENKFNFNWCLFCDIDEFLDGVQDINEFLSDNKFIDYDQIRIKWKLFSDNDLIDRDRSVPVHEAFTKQSDIAKKYIQDQSKSIVRGGIDNIVVCSTHFSAIGSIDWNKEELGNNKRDFSNLTTLRSCLPSGKPCNSEIIIKEDYSNEDVFINHYMTKSLKEFIDQKLSRGDACFYDRDITFDYYWKVNRKTSEKIDYIDSFINKYHKQIHFVMPTCSPNEFFNKFFTCLGVFEKIKDNATFGIIFQKPYTKKDIDKVAKEFKERGLILLYDFKEYSGENGRTPLMKMRDDAAHLNPNADYYLNVDDDMIYTCTAEFFDKVLKDSMNFMEENNVGTIIFGYPSHNDPYKEVMNDGDFHKRSGDAWASMGMLLKNVYNGHIVPEDAINCIGGNDDVLMADCRTYLNNMPCYYYGVALGHHTDIKDTQKRSMNRLSFKDSQYIDGSCRRYIQRLRDGEIIKKIDSSKIDIVILWVNPADTKWRSSYDDNSRREGKRGFDQVRFRDYGTLNYLLRGIEKNASWVNKVHLILSSPTQIPNWLNTDNSKLKIHYHNEFIPINLLPTFNSNCIELFLNRISDLSEYYILFNDDQFILNKLDKNMFVEDGKPVMSVEEKPLKFLIHSMNDFHTTLDNNLMFSINYCTERGLRLRNFKHHHLPEIHKKSLEQSIVNSNMDIFILSLIGSRFRSRSNFMNWVFSDIIKLRNECINKSIYSNSIYTKLYLDTDYTTIRSKQLVCINDDTRDDFSECTRRLKMFLNSIYPNKSSFEK